MRFSVTLTSFGIDLRIFNSWLDVFTQCPIIESSELTKGQCSYLDKGTCYDCITSFFNYLNVLNQMCIMCRSISNVYTKYEWTEFFVFNSYELL